MSYLYSDVVCSACYIKTCNRHSSCMCCVTITLQQTWKAHSWSHYILLFKCQTTVLIRQRTCSLESLHHFCCFLALVTRPLPVTAVDKWLMVAFDPVFHPRQGQLLVWTISGLVSGLLIRIAPVTSSSLEEKHHLDMVVAKVPSVTSILALITVLLKLVTTTTIGHWPRIMPDSKGQLETPFVNFSFARVSTRPPYRNGTNVSRQKVSFDVSFPWSKTTLCIRFIFQPQESRTAAVLQFLEKVLKLKNKSFQSPIARTDLGTGRQEVKGNGNRSSSFSLLRKQKERLEALKKLLDIAGEDWDRQFKKKRQKEKVKKTTISFVCPEANIKTLSNQWKSKCIW